MTVLGLLMAAPAGAQTVVDGSDASLDPSLVATIQALVTRGFAVPGAAEFRKLHLSKARNGHGYCGEVAVAAGADFVPFHAILEEAGPSSLLLLSDYAKPGEAGDRETAVRLLTNFGCLE
ncbi:hypothetical protein [Kaistia sp. 32K]|uniref:hypothetical protein n=1 Tax=Kaistia sp. 32K TaxID=2795690 RepID=UPI0019150E9E|nr:hypothetical protein [Kaistia sp. 32K]